MVQIPLVSLAIVVFTSWLVRRLLGITRGRWGATAGAIVLGEAATLGILHLVTGDAIGLGWEWYPLGITLVVTLSMLALTVIELLSRRRTVPRSLQVPHPVRAVRRRMGRSARYAQVSAIAVRSGLLGRIGDDLDENPSRLGRALAVTFEEAGGLFVKLGQAMASQPQLITPGIARELARLQDQAAPADPVAAIEVLTDELGPLADTFAAFPEQPVATASIGQTYFATLLDGRDVVVKVQRPGIRESMERDLDILARLATRLERGTTWARALGVSELAAGFADSTREELDFTKEAAHGLDARAGLVPGDRITVPDVLTEFTTPRVLVQERIAGCGVGTPGAFDGMPAADRAALADDLLGLVVRQMTGGGRFHADPHAGNVFVQPDGTLALIDFGAVGRLDRYERIGLIDLFRGLELEDPALLRQAALRFGTPVGRIDSEALDRELARVLTRATGVDGRLDTAVIGDLVLVFRDFGLRLPRSITALFRTVFTLSGTLETIAPGYDLLDGVRRLSGGSAAPLIGPHGLRAFAEREVLALAPVLSRLPGTADELGRALLRGELRTRVSLLSEPEDVRVLQSMIDRGAVVLIGAAGLGSSALLLGIDPVTPMQSVTVMVGGIGFAFSALLLLRTVVQILRTR